MMKIRKFLLLCGASFLITAVQKPNKRNTQVLANEFTYNDFTTKDLFSLNSATLINDSVAVPSNTTIKGEKGILFNMAPSGSTIVYENLVDLKEVDGDLVRYFTNIEEKAFKFINFRVSVIDAFDSSNYFSIENNQNLGVVSGYWKNQKENWPVSGCMNSMVSVVYNGNKYAIPNYDPVNYPDRILAWNQCFYCYEKMDNFVPLSFGFDINTNTVNIEIKKNQRIDLFDLDDPTDEAPDFPGFTTGEVYIRFETIGSGGSILINQIGNDNFTNLSDKLFKKNTGNILAQGGIASHDIVGAVNNYMPLPIFTKSKKDIDAKLYKLNPTTEITNVDLNNFYPSTAGEYELVLKSDNLFNEVITKKYNFLVNDNPIDIVDLDKPTFNYKIREIFSVPNIHFSGGNGNLRTEYKLRQNDSYTIIQPESRCSINKKGIVSELIVTVFDEIGQSKSFVYTINIDYNYFYFQINDSFNNISIVKYNTFVIPSFTAIDYSLDGDCESTNVNISIRQGLYSSVFVGDLITITSDTIIYFLRGQEIVDTINIHCAPNNVSMTDPDKHIKKQYGDLSSFENVVVNALGTSFIVNGDNSTLLHPYSLSVADLNIEFALLAEHNFSEIIFSLISLNGNSIEIKLTELHEKPILYLNGVRTFANITVSEESYLYGDDELLEMASFYRYKFSINALEKMIYNGVGRKIGTIDKWSNGEDFDYFKNGCCQLKITLIGGVLGDSFILTKLANQPFNSNGFNFGDRVAPCVSFEKPIKTQSVSVGDSFTIPKAFAYDVLDSSSTIALTIYKFDGSKLVQSISANEFNLKFENYGQYTVVFEVEDSKGRSNAPSYSFYVTDLEAPSITLDGTYNAAYKEKVEIISASVSDNFDKDVVVRVWIVDEASRYTNVSFGQSVSLKTGWYKIVYYATDSSGNIAHLEFDIFIE